jgi:hypothetical protein
MLISAAFLQARSKKQGISKRFTVCASFHPGEAPLVLVLCCRTSFEQVAEVQQLTGN